jgi:hypothetical protein
VAAHELKKAKSAKQVEVRATRKEAKIQEAYKKTKAKEDTQKNVPASRQRLELNPRKGWKGGGL